MNLLAPLLSRWYEAHARDLPWRRAEVTAWGILVSEVMLQQTPASRVIPYWRYWTEQWPTPDDLAEATPAEVIRTWGTLGYPRRGLRLRECAVGISTHHAGVVPDSEDILLSLPGIGEYTAAAVCAFAYGRRTVVLDTNIRRVISRTMAGEALPTASLTTSERALAASLVPTDPAEAVRWNQATMELGAMVCKARSPECDSCPAAHLCAWRAADYPCDVHADKRKPQSYAGTDRQARGRVMSLLRQAEGESIPLDAIVSALPRPDQTQRAVASLIADGLAQQTGEALSLPKHMN